MKTDKSYLLQVASSAPAADRIFDQNQFIPGDSAELSVGLIVRRFGREAISTSRRATGKLGRTTACDYWTAKKAVLRSY